LEDSMSAEQQGVEATVSDSDISFAMGQEDRAADAAEYGMNRLVPVSEAIKYRKRAQAAEQIAEKLSRELKDLEQQRQEEQRQLAEAAQERELTCHLVKAGVIDLEAGILLAKTASDKRNGEVRPLKEIIEAMRRERPYLFGPILEKAMAGTSGLTAGVRREGSSGVTALAQIAQRASQSGSRQDMRDYLRLRRSVRRGV
jgi:hypothetical protein